MPGMLATLFVTMVLTAWLTSAGRAAPAPAPTCEAGPVTVGAEIHGTPCDDRIVAPSNVETVEGGGGNDVILPAAIAASDSCPPGGCHLGVGSQTFDGGPGNDVVFGERGNDTLNGGEGNDRLYGGIGDDRLRGGPGDDLLSGGFGADSIDGEGDDDFVRGDPTVDRIADSGGNADTLSYGTGVTPGFSSNPDVYPDFSEYPNFPATVEGRGAYINLTAGIGDNGVAPDGGGVDEVAGTGFEKVIGTPFSDFIVGTSAGETIYGGGGADVIFGEGGDDRIYGGADGDHLDGGPGGDMIDGGSGTDSCEGFEPANPCETNGKGVVLRDASKIAVGLMAPEESVAAELYLAGSDVDDSVTATYSPTSPPTVTFQLEAGSVGAFDSSPSVAGGCGAPAADKVVCALAEAPDSIVLAGMTGNDSLGVAGFPDSTSVIVLGGNGGDSLTGGEGNEDVLGDGPGNDVLDALSGDDALLNTEGTDTLDAGLGSDLLLSDSICDNDQLSGGMGDNRDNASWTKLKEPVAAWLDTGVAGRPVGGEPSCSGGGSLDHLQTIEDLEGTSQGDFFHGDFGNNQLLGHLGPDSYFALPGNDTILANSADSDAVIDCGDGSDTAFVDHPTATYADPSPIGCETVYEADPNSFSPPGIPTGPPPPAPGPIGPSETAPRDTTPPRTKLLHRPAKTVFTTRPRRMVTFAFASNEVGASFRCKLDRDGFKPCRSPRAYRLRPGRHAFRAFAVDAAGNRDPSPVLFSFTVARRTALQH